MEDLAGTRYESRDGHWRVDVMNLTATTPSRHDVRSATPRPWHDGMWFAVTYRGFDHGYYDDPAAVLSLPGFPVTSMRQVRKP